jgi:catechol 2,3-dioxygenase-like lactoylglutathione lyase family enzyme
MESSMPVATDTISTKPKLVAAEPQLFVADITASCAFFESKLGFSIVFTYGEPPYYAQVKRDGARLNLRCVEGPAIDPGLRDREELLSATIMVASAGEVTQLARDFQQAGVSFAQAPAKKPWGALDFIVRDIDGNLLLFAGPSA